MNQTKKRAENTDVANKKQRVLMQACRKDNLFPLMVVTFNPNSFFPGVACHLDCSKHIKYKGKINKNDNKPTVVTEIVSSCTPKTLKDNSDTNKRNAINGQIMQSIK